MRLVTGREMREIDRVSIEERGIPGSRLMERAGRALAEVIEEEFDRGVLAIVCGRGNNGGDGLVAARHLERRGWLVRVALLAPPSEFQGDARWAWEELDHNRVLVVECRDRAQLESALEGAEVILDALLGTGLSGAPRPPMDWAIEAINAAGAPVVAADVPSGLADAQETAERSAGPVVQAVRTVTMGLPKVALYTEQGLERAGGVTVAPLDFPRDLIESPSLWRNLLTLTETGLLLRARPRRGHKGTFGALLVIAGSAGMSGAAILAGRAATRSGCGLVYMAPPSRELPAVEAALAEPVKWPLPGAAEYLDLEAAAFLLQHAGRCTAAALGPGLGTRPETRAAVLTLIERLECPLVLDADALNALADAGGVIERLRARRAPTVLTPHPGEMARLAGKTVEDIQAARFAAARDFARQAAVTLVLKGAGTVIATPAGDVYLNPTGNSGLAKGGSGDVLTGLLGGLLAQGYSAGEAAQLGVFLHGLAADLAAEGSSPYALTATDVIERFGAAFRRLEKRGAAPEPGGAIL